MDFFCGRRWEDYNPNPLQKQPEKERMTGRQGYYGNGNKGGSSFVRTTPVKTGDDTEILFWLLLGGAALFAGVW